MYKVLIVEDTLAIREELYDILLLEGYSVFEAENGLIGLEMTLKEQPDLIISDILMPKLNGFEMFKMLRKDKRTSSIPLIFLSAKGEKENIRTGMNLGAEDFLVKPIIVKDLLNAIENKIKKKLIIDQKIIDKTTALSTILMNKKDEIDNYARLISHELKSSLRNVSDQLTWFKDDIDKTIHTEDSINNFRLMEENIVEMDLILEKLEHYNNITSATFKNKYININTIVEQVINEINKPSNITIKIKKELPTLFADKNMMKKVFQILIGNALDHINKKNGLIEIGCETTEKDYVFSIKDNGIGIELKYQEKIFKMFQVIESTRSSGLGLSIVKNIISRYEGDVSVKSTPNRGTTFYFNLPNSGLFTKKNGQSI
jgi:signal transduction histidine kinase